MVARAFVTAESAVVLLKMKIKHHGFLVSRARLRREPRKPKRLEFHSLPARTTNPSFSSKRDWLAACSNWYYRASGWREE